MLEWLDILIGIFGVYNEQTSNLKTMEITFNCNQVVVTMIWSQPWFPQLPCYFYRMVTQNLLRAHGGKQVFSKKEIFDFLLLLIFSNALNMSNHLYNILIGFLWYCNNKASNPTFIQQIPGISAGCRRRKAGGVWRGYRRRWWRHTDSTWWDCSSSILTSDVVLFVLPGCVDRPYRSASQWTTTF